MRLLGFVGAALLVSACRNAPTTADPPTAPASPQASAIPAPLANVPTTTASAASLPLGADAGPPAVPLRADRAVPPEVLPRDVAGYTLEMLLHPADPPPLARGGEVSASGMEAARKRTEARLVVDLSATRARIELASHGFVLPDATELRARSDRLGHLVLLPETGVYRIAAPGALRALLAERRLDVAPLAPVDVVGAGEGGKRLGYRTRKVTVAARAGRGVVEIARVEGAGEGGVLLCRALLELLAGLPTTSMCAIDEIPLRAEIRWGDAKGPGLVVEATTIVRRLDLGGTQLATPPVVTGFAAGPLPGPRSALLLSPPELTALRTGPQDVAGAGARAPASEPHATLTLVNAEDELRFVWLDGIPIAWIAPGDRVETPALYRGRYTVEWRSFLGDVLDPPRPVTLPAEVSPKGDAGAP